MGVGAPPVGGLAGQAGNAGDVADGDCPRRKMVKRPSRNLHRKSYVRCISASGTLATVSETDSMRDWLGEMFAQIGERFDAVDERFDTVDERFDAVDERFAHVDGRFDRLEARIEEVAAVNGTLIDEVARINQRLG